MRRLLPFLPVLVLLSFLAACGDNPAAKFAGWWTWKPSPNANAFVSMDAKANSVNTVHLMPNDTIISYHSYYDTQETKDGVFYMRSKYNFWCGWKSNSDGSVDRTFNTSNGTTKLTKVDKVPDQAITRAKPAYLAKLKEVRDENGAVAFTYDAAKKKMTLSAEPLRSAIGAEVNIAGYGEVWGGGNIRVLLVNVYTEDGKRFGFTINPGTGTLRVDKFMEEKDDAPTKRERVAEIKLQKLN